MSPQQQESVRHVLDALYLLRLTLRDLFTTADSQRRGRVQGSQLVLALQAALDKDLADASRSRAQEARNAPGHLARLLQQSAQGTEDRMLLYDAFVQLLQLPARPVDWEQVPTARMRARKEKTLCRTEKTI